jgi:cytidine diphosphoramidate kinase
LETDGGAGMIVWFIGMSGSGKTTLAEVLHQRIKPKTRHLVYLDGDMFRQVFRDDVDHSIEGRRRNAERLSGLCKVLDNANIHVIAAVLSIFPEWQQWNRRAFSCYREVFLDVPMETLRARDTKGLYSGAEAGEIENVVGFDIAFPRPPNPDLVISIRHQEKGVDACIKMILDCLPSFD